jgi:hypothetical protein
MYEYISIIGLTRREGEPEEKKLVIPNETWTRVVGTVRDGVKVSNLYGDDKTPGRTRVDFGKNLTLVSRGERPELVDLYGDNGKGGMAVFIEVGGEIKLQVTHKPSDLSEVIIRRRGVLAE